MWFSLPGHYRVTDEALLAETTKYDQSSFLWMFSLLLKELIFDFYLSYNVSKRCSGNGKHISGAVWSGS